MGNDGESTTTGVNTFGAPANAKNILAVGATLSSNVGTGWSSLNSAIKTWNLQIGGPDAAHGAHSKIRGLNPYAFVSNPQTHQLLSAVSVVYAEPAEACSALTNAAAVAGKLVLISRGTCAFSTKVGLYKLNPVHPWLQTTR